MSGVHLGRRGPDALDSALTAARGQSPTYDHVGSTFGTGPPPGIDEHRFERAAEGTIDVARQTLRRWATHAGIGAHVHPAGVKPDEGETVVVTLPFGPVELLAPCRVVAVVDEPDRCGFAYGTLRGHPERGEEGFLAEAAGDGHLLLTVRIHARPASLLTRLGGPVTTAVQSRAARRYLSAWAAAIGDEAR